jgi:hypothetical protein
LPVAGDEQDSEQFMSAASIVIRTLPSRSCRPDSGRPLCHETPGSKAPDR